MYKLRLFCLILVFALIYNILSAQESDNQTKKKKIQELKELYLENTQKAPFLAIEFAAQALQLAESIKDSIEIATIYNYLGDSYFERKSYSIALDNYYKSYKIFQRFGDELNVAYSYLDIGAIYFEQNLSTIAYNYYEKAKQIFQENDDKRGLSFTHDKIGFALLKQGDENGALQHFIDSDYFRKGLKDTLLSAISNKNISEVYLVREEYKKAISFLKEASEKFRAINSPLNIADADYKIGKIYLSNKEFDKAIEYYFSAFENYEKFDKQHEIALTYNELAKAYFGKNKPKLLKEYASKALEIGNNFELLDVKADAYSLLSQYYEIKKNIKKAFQFERMHSNVVDSISQAKYISQSAEMQVSFEIQNQEKEIEILTKSEELNKITIRNQQLIAIVIGVVSTLLLFFAINLYKSNIARKRNNLLLTKQKKDIEDKNFELERQKDAIEEKNVRIQRINKNITGSINYASRIQQAMLPKPSTYLRYLKDVFVYFKPREVVSGDFYWFSRDEKQNKIFVAAVDCTGHGVPGAFMSLIGNTYLNQIVNAHHITEADLILNKLHENIRTSLHQAKNQSRDGMDIALCVIDYNKKTIDFAGARNPMIYIKNNELFQIKGDNMDIGGIQREKERRFTKQTIPLEENMQIYLFSDGFQDQFGGPDKNKFMRKNFKDLLLKIHKSDMMIQMQLLEETFNSWTTMEDGSQLDQIDDILVIGLRL
jgi:serine phosphatase RsbU (regulator of sigma subunit)